MSGRGLASGGLDRAAEHSAGNHVAYGFDIADLAPSLAPILCGARPAC
jgi:hypothetical protein